MHIVFRTNLDEPKNDVWDLNRRIADRARYSSPEALFVPRKGDRICFPFKRCGENFEYSLDVCGVEVDYVAREIRVELHLPAWQAAMTLTDWRAWFRRHRHGVSE